MYLDIPANDNTDLPCMATFKETGPSQALSTIRLWRDEAWQWCAITGWDEAGPVPASITAIEESGDGPALLVHGGAWGLRLAVLAADRQPPLWSVADPTQWGDGFLLVRPDCEYA